MKKLLLSLFLTLCGVAHAQSIDSFYELTLDGKPWFRFGSQVDCDAAVKGYGDLPEVKAKGAGAVFDCPRRIRFVPAASPLVVAPPPVVAPPVVTRPVATGRGMTAGCEAVVAADFKPVEGMSNPAVPALAKPARGVAVREPTFGTCLMRATDMAADANRKGDFVRNDYSRRQAFNSDSSKFFAYEYDGEWLLYDAKTMAKLGTLQGPGGDAELQWSATDPDLYYYTGTNGYGLALHERSVSTGKDRVVGDFGARLMAKWPSAFFAWTKSEGSPSADGRYWCFMVDSADWQGLGLFTWDKQTDTIIAMADHPGGVRPDSVSMSPSGNYCAWYGDTIRAFSRDLKTNKSIGTAEHSDLGLDADGKDVLISVDYQANGGPVYATDLATGVRRIVIPQTYIAGTATAMHFSAKAFNKPGWFVWSTYADYDSWTPPTGRQWLHKKVMAVEMKENGLVLQLAHTRVRTPSADFQYWAEPHASVNRDFTRILFNSNWDVDTELNIEAFMVQIPAGAVK